MDHGSIEDSVTDDAQNAAAAPRDGIEVVRAQLRTLPQGPGVYRMLDGDGQALYVGKAKNLKRRVASYAKPTGQSNRIRRMVSMTRSMEIVTTHTEVEALLLEANLIKKLRPRYNIILRDDKSFPYILITGDHDWPQITKHRGARTRKGEYFGPFASAGAVNQTLAVLQRLFPLRSCSDSDFETRTRPCLQYQIKRCAGPCVGRISPEDYQAMVDEARAFLAGRSHDIQKQLSERMARASDALDFEAAAVYRDRLKALAHIQSRQGINLDGVGEADIMAAHSQAGQTCIQVFFFRAGQNFGNRAYYPSHSRDDTTEEVLAAFAAQFYDTRPAPSQVLLSHEVAEHDLLAEALAVRAGRKVEILAPKRGPKKSLLQHALDNARDALGRRLAESASQKKLLEGVAQVFGLDAPPRRIEVYDNSHISGTKALGSMIVAGPDGFMKNAYRQFNIRSGDIAPGDDYGMMREVLTRRFARLLRASDRAEEGKAEGGKKAARPDMSEQWPDLVLIDGGRGQLNVVVEVFRELGIEGVGLAAIAKGPERNAGRERFFMEGREAFSLPERDPTLYFLQRLRDEAHRFAIGSHRARRSKAIGQSPLDEIPGVGPRRKKALLNHFGSARAVGQAALADLEAIEGISNHLARAIYDHFNNPS